MQQLIAALGNDIKRSGRNWVAKCPVHSDKDFAMSIKQVDDGSVIAHCFACGANGLDLYKALGLDLTELFGGREQEKPHIPHMIQEQYDLDKMVISIYKADEDAGREISFQDKKRFRLAVARTKGIEDKYGI